MGYLFTPGEKLLIGRRPMMNWTRREGERRRGKEGEWREFVL